MEFDPESIRISDLTLTGDGASLTGNLTYGREAAALNGRIEFSGHRLEEFQWLGVPVGIAGVVRSASFRVAGTVSGLLVCLGPLAGSEPLIRTARQTSSRAVGDEGCGPLLAQVQVERICGDEIVRAQI